MSSRSARAKLMRRRRNEDEVVGSNALIADLADRD